MPRVKIAIVGRPNVGKSSLLNRLAGRRVSIVDPTPGVTRDRVAQQITLDPPLSAPGDAPQLDVEVIDTGGYGVYTAEGGRYDDVGADLADLTPEIEQQIAVARRDASVILFLIDAQAGITALDETVARLIREEGSSARVLLVANKVDSDSWVPHGLEAAGLGFGEPMCVSMTSRFGLRDLLDVLYERSFDAALALTGGDAAALEDDEPEELKVAIVGRRNAGKSTLINALAGEPRVIVSEIAGTTRDCVDVRFEIEGRTMLAIDTAGLRKRKSFSDDIEYYAYHRMLRAIRRSDVAVLLVDARRKVSQVDKKLSLELQRQHKPTIIAVNKWDLVDESKVKPEEFLEYLTRELRGLDYAPIVFISALETDGMRDLVALAFNLHQQASHRVSTGQLNDVMEQILQQRGPSSKLGTQAKLYYITQVETSPPTIVMVVNDPKLFEGNYERYILNRLRDELPYSEVPIRLVFKKRGRKSLHQLKFGTDEQQVIAEGADAGEFLIDTADHDA